MYDFEYHIYLYSKYFNNVFETYFCLKYLDLKLIMKKKYMVLPQQILMIFRHNNIHNIFARLIIIFQKGVFYLSKSQSVVKLLCVEGRSYVYIKTTWFIVTRNRKINLTDVFRIIRCQISNIVAQKWLDLLMKIVSLK